MNASPGPRPWVFLARAAFLAWLAWTHVAPPTIGPQATGTCRDSGGRVHGPTPRVPRRSRFSLVVSREVSGRPVVALDGGRSARAPRRPSATGDVPPSAAGLLSIRVRRPGGPASTRLRLRC